MNRSSRAGYTLIEMTAVIGICSILAGVSVWLVHMSMQKTRDGQRHLASRQAVARLAETFRRDVHAAVSIAADSAEENGDAREQAAWTLRLDSGNEVRYRLDPGRVIRDEFRPPSSVPADKPTAVRHETFDLLHAAEMSISLEPPSAPRIATLSIVARDVDTSADTKQRLPLGKVAIQSVRVDAAVSIANRFRKIKTVETGTAPVTEEAEE